MLSPAFCDSWGINQAVNQPINQPTDRWIKQSVNHWSSNGQSISQSINQSINAPTKQLFQQPWASQSNTQAVSNDWVRLTFPSHFIIILAPTPQSITYSLLTLSLTPWMIGCCMNHKHSTCQVIQHTSSYAITTLGNLHTLCIYGLWVCCITFRQTTLHTSSYTMSYCISERMAWHTLLILLDRSIK